ncbi:hypothetical protein FM103_09065 [Corynebacterium xerosis]|nr:hypothetical protein FM103_09065 [Corynebacterium xerosis]
MIPRSCLPRDHRATWDRRCGGIHNPSHRPPLHVDGRSGLCFRGCPDLLGLAPRAHPRSPTPASRDCGKGGHLDQNSTFRRRQWLLPRVKSVPSTRASARAFPTRTAVPRVVGTRTSSPCAL